jgi:hypothetical protein
VISILRIVQAMVINGITIYGVFGAQWTVGTAIALYWSENVIGIVLITLRFLLHRILTHKRGHSRGVLRDFLTVTAVFTAAHGLFVFLFIGFVFPRVAPAEAFDRSSFKLGLMLIGGVMLLGFLVDALAMKDTPFAAVRFAADSFMPRVLVVHLTIIFGLLAMAIFGHARALFAVFAALKFLADMISRAPKEFGETPPRWFVWFAKRTGDQNILEKWRREREGQLARIADDELPMAGA